jgi:hypothetical protein
LHIAHNVPGGAKYEIPNSFAFFIASDLLLLAFFVHSLHSGLLNLYPFLSNASVPDVFPLKLHNFFSSKHFEQVFICVFAHSYSSYGF